MILKRSTPVPVVEEPVATVWNERNVGQMLKDLEEKLAAVKQMEESDFSMISSKPMMAEDGEEVDPMANDLAEEMMREAVQITEQKDRELRAKEAGGFDLEHSFDLEQDEQRSLRPTQRLQGQFKQPVQQYTNQEQFPSQEQFPNQEQYSNQEQYPRQQQYQGQEQFRNEEQYEDTRGPYQGNQRYQGQNQRLQDRNQYQQFQGQPAPRNIENSPARPRQISKDDQRSGLLNNFGIEMGEQLSADPEGNSFPTSPQLSPSRQALEDGSLAAPEEEEEEEKEEEVRCINKVMQVEVTVYEDKIKCQHTFTEKCHDTFVTDYIPTQERKCETSFDKNCHITYRPMVRPPMSTPPNTCSCRCLRNLFKSATSRW